MALFKFPYSTFNEVNLDWIMKKIKSLEPAVDMVEQADAALQQANAVSAEALRVAGEADDAVSTVTAQAAYAVQTADDAKTIAQQAAAATIADGSVTLAKLASDVISRFEADEADIVTADGKAVTAQNSANTAIGAAGVAQQLANQANSAAATANNNAAEALAKAEQALAQTSSTAWTLAGNSAGSAVSVPTGAKELLFVAYVTGYGSYKATAILPMNAVGAGGLLVEIPISLSAGTIQMGGIWVTPTSASPHNTSPSTVTLYFQMFYR